MNNLNQLLKILLQSKIDFVLIGGYAGVVHGSNQLTRDLDICVALTESHVEELRLCLRGIHPKHRMNPNFKPSFLDEPKDLADINAIYLETDLGILDILPSVVAVGDFEVVKKSAVSIEVFEQHCKVISLDHLIQSKEKMGREKDKIVLRELYSIREKLSQKL